MMSTQFCNGDSGPLAPSDFMLPLDFRRSSLIEGRSAAAKDLCFFTLGGVDGRLDPVAGPADDFGFVFRLLTGVLPNPSSLRRASAVSGSMSFSLGTMPCRVRWLSVRRRFCLLPDGGKGKGTAFCGGTVLPGEDVPDKSLMEPDALRNWVMDALEGLGGR